MHEVPRTDANTGSGSGQPPEGVGAVPTSSAPPVSEQGGAHLSADVAANPLASTLVQAPPVLPGRAYPTAPVEKAGAGAGGGGIPPGPGHRGPSTSGSLRPPVASGAGGKRGGFGRGLWLALGAVAILGLVGIAGMVYLVRSMDSGGSHGLGFHAASKHSDLREVVIEPASTRDKIAVIDMQGVISSDPVDYEGNSIINFIDDQLERAGEDEHVRAVLLKIDSPGGEVLASDEIYKLLAEFQEKHDKPVVASMGTVAASGGYYVAAPCRWIVANELTITGSIGVIMQSYNWRGLMDKVGVRPQVFKSGAFKDMLSPNKAESEISSDERRMVQDLVNETFEKFKSVIEEGRGLAHAHNEDNDGEEVDQGRPLAPNWKDFADGRLLSGKEAWKLGFVDELGDFTAAVERAEKLAGIEDSKLIQYMRPASFGSLFRMFGKSENARIQLDLGIAMPQMRAGLYFLAPHLIQSAAGTGALGRR